MTIKKVFGVVLATLITAAIMVGLFFGVCFIIATALDYPVLVAIALAIETLIFVPWELDSRKNYKSPCEKGGLKR